MLISLPNVMTENSAMENVVTTDFTRKHKASYAVKHFSAGGSLFKVKIKDNIVFVGVHFVTTPFATKASFIILSSTCGTTNHTSMKYHTSIMLCIIYGFFVKQ